MNSKMEFVTSLLNDMSGVLSEKQIDALANSLNVCLRDYVLEKEVFLPSVNEPTDNERFLKLFVASKRLEGMSEITIKKYVHQANLMLVFLDKDFRAVTTVDAQYYLSEYDRSHNICKCTLNNMRSAISGWYLWLYNNEFIQTNPMSRIGKFWFEKKPLEILTDDETILIKDACANNIRLRAIVDFLLATGVRVSELINVDIKDVNLQSNEVVIHSAKKRQKQTRTIYLTPDARKHLTDYLRLREKKQWNSSPALFQANRRGGKRLTERDFNTMLKKLAEEAGIEKHCTVHIFRKTLASVLYRRGMEPKKIAYILGHSDSRTSESYYITISTEDIKHDYIRYR